MGIGVGSAVGSAVESAVGSAVGAAVGSSCAPAFCLICSTAAALNPSIGV